MLSRIIKQIQILKTTPTIVRGLATNNEFLVTGTLVSENYLEIGQHAQVTHIFSQDDVDSFARLCGDSNPLHLSPEFAETTMFKGTIVHGIFVSSLFSTLFGKSIMGSIYVSQDLKFKRPVHVGVPVIARMEILSIEDKRKGLLMTCSTVVTLQNDQTAVVGEAKVLVPKSTT